MMWTPAPEVQVEPPTISATTAAMFGVTSGVPAAVEASGCQATDAAPAVRLERSRAAPEIAAGGPTSP
jgi:hypothetical protein